MLLAEKYELADYNTAMRLHREKGEKIGEKRGEKRGKIIGEKLGKIRWAP